MAAENKVDRLETLRRDALESIEKLVAFAHAKGLIDDTIPHTRAMD